MKFGDIEEYIAALRASKKFGNQVVCYKKIAAQDAQYGDLPPLDSDIFAMLKQRGITQLYSHQCRAITRICRKKDVLIATPTASGKSFIYNLPVLNDLYGKKRGHALYLFPLKALAQDQRAGLEAMYCELQHIKNVSSKASFSAIFDGDTSNYHRQKIKKEPPSVLISNPEMLHLSLLPYHEGWASFFSSLQYVVIDEVHTYRGIFGSHMAWVLRRLQRIARHYGAQPVFILLSATVGNPEELGHQLLGREIEVIDAAGAPCAKKDVLFLNPLGSAAHTASQLLEAAVKRELRTIVYTGSRKMTELVTLWTTPRLGKYAGRLSSYRAGFLPEERRDIEKRLASGELLGVISTSALELGIDIGSLDLCILLGYPGSIIATWQRGGRVGRAQRPSAIVLIGQEDALDQYFMRNPDDFFMRRPEDAVLDFTNEVICRQHLPCCAAELPLHGAEELVTLPKVVETLTELTAEGVLLTTASGQHWLAARRYPQRLVSLRGEGRQFTIVDGEKGECIGTIDGGRVCKECHTGAIYLHRTIVWQVSALHLEKHEVVVQKTLAKYHTVPLAEKSVDILSPLSSKQYLGIQVFFGEINVIEQVTGYQKKQNHTGKLLATVPLDLPEQCLSTKGVWLKIPASIVADMQQKRYHFMGAIHAMEHAMIAVFPLLVLCDRNDIGGVSTPLHPQTEQASIFIYDGYSGGIGLAEAAYHKMEELLAKTFDMVSSCQCESGCPSCVHSPKCGSGNRPIDKAACLYLLKELLSKECSDSLPSGENTVCIAGEKRKKRLYQPQLFTHTVKVDDILPERWGVFDLETIRSAQEVGGWSQIERMGMSVGVVYDSVLEDYVSYLESEVDALIAHLQQLDLVVGFNSKRFDNRVLAGYGAENIRFLPHFDLLEEVQNQLGYRVKLDNFAGATLGEGKAGDGLDALRWYKEGRIDDIVTYCRKDVEITKDLFLYGLEKSYLLFTNKTKQVVRLPLRLEKKIIELLSASA